MLERKLFLLLVVLGLVIIFLWYQNNKLTLSFYEFSADPEAGKETKGEALKIKTARDDSFSLVHLSDLHNKSFGPDNNKLLEKIKSTNPDLILITGDIIDSKRAGTESALNLVRELKNLAPVYFVSGNHEKWCGHYSTFQTQLESAGAIILENEGLLLENQAGKKIFLAGISDPDFSSLEEWQEDLRVLGEQSRDYFSILLSHRPERFDDYVTAGFNLALVGHAHGGQWRLPFFGGLIAPDQGLFPKYDGGQYQKVTTSMLVSRGLGNSVVPWRLFNLPELISIKIIF